MPCFWITWGVISMLCARVVIRVSKRVHDRLKYLKPIRGPKLALRGTLRVRHQPEYVALKIAYTRDIGDGAVGVVFVAHHDLVIFFELKQRRLIRVIIALAVRDGDIEGIALLCFFRERGIGALHGQFDKFTDKFERAVTQHRSGQKPRLQQDLKTVAYADDKLALVRVLEHTLHHRRKTRDAAGSQIITVAKTSGQHDAIVFIDITVLVPDKIRLLMHHMLEHMIAIMIAVGTRENNDTELHLEPFFLLASCVMRRALGVKYKNLKLPA